MTAAQKAKELVNEKFYQPVTIKLKGVGAQNNSKELWEYAKQCAIIVVDESIAAVESIIGYQSHMWKDGEKETHEYYQAIKKEIEKL